MVAGDPVSNSNRASGTSKAHSWSWVALEKVTVASNPKYNSSGKARKRANMCSDFPFQHETCTFKEPTEDDNDDNDDDDDNSSMWSFS